MLRGNLTSLKGAKSSEADCPKPTWLWRDTSNCQSHRGNQGTALRLKTKVVSINFKSRWEPLSDNGSSDDELIQREGDEVWQLASAPVRARPCGGQRAQRAMGSLGINKLSQLCWGWQLSEKQISGELVKGIAYSATVATCSFLSEFKTAAISLNILLYSRQKWATSQHNLK